MRRPGLDAAVLRLDGHARASPSRSTGRRSASATRSAPAGGAVMEAALNVACAGGEPIALTDCLNFGNPERPEIAWELARAIDGIAEAANELGIPVVSGNVSLYNETGGRPIPPTPVVGCVGLVPDVTRIPGRWRRGDRALLLRGEGAALVRFVWQQRAPLHARPRRLGTAARRARCARRPPGAASRPALDCPDGPGRDRHARRRRRASRSAGTDDPSELGSRLMCGVFGICAPDRDVARLSYFGLYALQHRGQESAGIAVSEHGRLTGLRDLGLVTQVFDEQKLSGAPRRSSRSRHTRYSTTGSNAWANAQPLIHHGTARTVALGHNGNLTNADELREELAPRLQLDLRQRGDRRADRRRRAAARGGGRRRARAARGRRHGRRARRGEAVRLPRRVRLPAARARLARRRPGRRVRDVRARPRRRDLRARVRARASS